MLFNEKLSEALLTESEKKHTTQRQQFGSVTAVFYSLRDPNIPVVDYQCTGEKCGLNWTTYHRLLS